MFLNPISVGLFFAFLSLFIPFTKIFLDTRYNIMDNSYSLSKIIKGEPNEHTSLGDAILAYIYILFCGFMYGALYFITIPITLILLITALIKSTNNLSKDCKDNINE